MHYQCNCKRCYAIWLTRMEGGPKQCPYCHTYKWREKPRQRRRYYLERLKPGDEVLIRFPEGPDGEIDHGALYRQNQAIESYARRTGKPITVTGDNHGRGVIVTYSKQ